MYYVKHKSDFRDCTIKSWARYLCSEYFFNLAFNGRGGGLSLSYMWILQNVPY